MNSDTFDSVASTRVRSQVQSYFGSDVHGTILVTSITRLNVSPQADRKV